MRRIVIAIIASLALLVGAIPNSANAAASGWKVYSLNPSSQAFSSKQAPGSSGATAQFLFAAMPDTDSLLVTDQPGGPHASLTGTTITAMISVDGAATFASRGDCGNTPPTVRFFFNTNGPFDEANYWWSNSAVNVDDHWALAGDSTTTISAAVQPSEWTDFFGHRGTDFPDLFAAAAANPSLVGLSFGGGCFFENGVGTTSGSATFKLVTFTIE